MNSKSLNSFLLQEGLRQDAVINDTASQLTTKNGLFMVFAAFVFTAESTLASNGKVFGYHMPNWALIGPLVLSLISILLLVGAALIHKYKEPPILPDLRTQAEKFFQLAEVRNLPETEQMAQMEIKFLNSLTRSIEHNHNLNGEISEKLKEATWFVGASILWLGGLVVWPTLVSLVHVFRCY